MSFGRPGGFGDNFKFAPPERGSFPLDHDGECRTFMLSHLKCIKLNKGDNGKCRLQARQYLECRMDKGLMQRDDMRNLGLGDVVDPALADAKLPLIAPVLADPPSAEPPISGPTAASMERI